ncbi:MAG: hypothetical protein AB7L09_03345 [Nitrospira sp.]
MAGLEFGTRTGHVDFYDFDEAMAIALGGQEDPIKNQWFLPLTGIYVKLDGRQEPIDRALVVYKRPEPTQISATVPMIAIIRDSTTPAEERLQSPTVSYRLPCEGAKQVSAGGVTGWTSYEQKDFEQPYDLFYTIECWARFRTVAQILLQIMMKRFPMRGQTVVVVDGINNPRTYAVYQQNVTDLTDVSSMVERIPGYSLSVRVEGELTLDREPKCISAFTGTQSTEPLPGAGGPGYQLVPGPGGYGLVPADENGIPLAGGGTQNPDPGVGGLYGTGSPIIRTGVYGSNQR